MDNNILDTGVKRVRNVTRFNVGFDSFRELFEIINKRRITKNSFVVFLIDEFFCEKNEFLNSLPIQFGDLMEFISTKEEPTTEYIDELCISLKLKGYSNPVAIVGIGGGIVLDITKAISNLLTNGGRAADYQGWDLVKCPGVFKIGVPTISGTGAEATRTCVMTNSASGLKLGMNSDYTVFDHIIMDPKLTATVPYNQYFYTGMDAYIHCMESLAGSYRNAVGDAYSRETINLCRQVFHDNDMMNACNREKLMVASYLGGCAIATSYVGLVHPFSAGLSVVLGLHHCIANCIVMRAMQPYYPQGYDEFWIMAEKQDIHIPEGIARNLTDSQYEQIFISTVIHQKPLTNALGENYLEILTKEKVVDIFKAM